MSVICEKGVIRNALAGIESLPIELPLFEVIDNREHSKSKIVFIDIDMHHKKIVFGFSEKATKEQIDGMVKWYSINNNHYDGNNIASRAAGKKFWDFMARGNYTHTSKSVNEKYFQSQIDTNKIYNAEINPEITNDAFSKILTNETTSAKEIPEIISSIQNIFENKSSYYPFNPETIFYTTDIINSNMFEYFFNNKEDIIKNLRIKYYNEFIETDFKLYIKFPNSDNFINIHDTDDFLDVIGITSNFIKKLTINIYISKLELFKGYIFKIDNNFYKFKKNGNTVLREKIENLSDYIDIQKPPDYSFVQYNTNEFTKEQKEKSIVGKSLEHYAGLYINIGGKFINSEKVKWNVTDRNLSGNKNYRCVLYIKTNDGKSDIGLSGLKAQFNLSNKENLHFIIKSFTDIYKKYIQLDLPENSDEYVVIKTTAQKSIEVKKLIGYFYICCVGENFYKFGYCTTHTRYLKYGESDDIKSTRTDFNEEKIYDNPYMIYVSLNKISNVQALEQNIKCIVNDKDCVTYEGQGDDIREFFHCDNFYTTIYPKILNEINSFY